MSGARGRLAGGLALGVLLLALFAWWWGRSPAEAPVAAPEVARVEPEPERPRAAAASAPAPVIGELPPLEELVPEARTEDAPVYGRVRGAEQLPEGAVFVEGCGLRATNRDTPVAEDGTFFASVKPGRCEMRAWRANGPLRIPGPWVSLDPQPGVEIDVELSVPTYEPAGMGIGFEPGAGGVEITIVHPNTPAARAGLEVGDLITSIDGVVTDGMDVEQFLQHGIGKEGSPVELQGTGADGQAFRVVIRRQPIHLAQ